MYVKLESMFHALFNLFIRLFAWDFSGIAPLGSIEMLKRTGQRQALKKLSRRLRENPDRLVSATIAARFADDIGGKYPTFLDEMLMHVVTHGSLDVVLPRVIAAEMVFGFQEPGVDGSTDWDRVFMRWIQYEPTMSYESITAFERHARCPITPGIKRLWIDALLPGQVVDPAYLAKAMCIAAHGERHGDLMTRILAMAVSFGFTKRAIELAMEFNHRIDSDLLRPEIPNALHEAEDPALAVLIGKYIGELLNSDTLRDAAQEYALARNDRAAAEALRLAEFTEKPLLAQMQQ